MLKALTLAATTAFALASPAQADLLLRGTMVWTSASGCPGQFVGTTYNTQLHPRNATNNFTGLTIISSYGAVGYHIDGQNFSPAQFLRMTTGGVGSSDYVFQFPTLIRATQSPPTITASTQTARLSGFIKNPFGTVANCVIGFNASYVPLPNP
jgi:hypothetical protein